MKEEKKKKKLTYEELEAYSNQTMAQAKAIYNENQKLLQENKRLLSQMNYTEINLAFKVLELKENFSTEFLQKVVKRLEEVLTPMEQSDESQEQNND